jgi:hypothetical protein
LTDPPPRRDRRPIAYIDALEAVSAKSAGKSRAEVEQLLRDELTERGLESPESLIRSAADVLTRPRGLFGHARTVRFGLRPAPGMASGAGWIADILAAGEAGAGPIKDPADRTSGWVDVLLDDGGKTVLRSRRERLSLPADARDQVAVRLQRVETATSASVVAAYVDEFRVGTLTRKDGVPYLPAIAAGRERGERGLLTLGLSTMTSDAEPRLRIAPAAPA